MQLRRDERTQRTVSAAMNTLTILVLGAVFYYIWFEYFRTFAYFYRIGNWAVLGIYLLLLVVFNQMYGGFGIGYSTTGDLIFSHIISLFFSNASIFILAMLVGRRVLPARDFLLYFLSEILVVVFLNILNNQIYYRIFPPRKTLMIFEQEDPSIYRRILKYQSNSYDIQKQIPYRSYQTEEKMIRNYDCVIAVGLTPEEKEQLVKSCYGFGKSLYLIPDICDVLINSATNVYLVDTPVLKTNTFGPSQIEKIFKRLFDIIFAIVFLVLTSPIFLITAIAIKAEDHGPVFYVQTRLTQFGRKFGIIKFRSMRTDAEKDGVARFASEHDSRITKVGRFIRSCRIDELPQLLNILKGDMSVVGPRPERPEIVAKITEDLPEFNYRLKVKAGLTGYAQVYGKYNTRLKDKLLFDLIYIEHFSIGLDVRIMFMTFKILFKKDSTEGVEES
ncbi:MAG: sugar transferase [Erysipelotrichaceae bacterium]|nr:sugar transferase [Erysipelotrichaceae bacterium]